MELSVSLPRWRVLGLSVLVAVALLGVWRVVAHAQPGPPAASLQVGGATYTVIGAEEVPGISAQDVNGMTHGISGLVSAGEALIRVTITITGGDGPVAYDASVLRVLATAPGQDGTRGQVVEPVGGSVARGRLAPGGRLDGEVSFVVPRDGSRLSLTAGTSRPVPLLRLDVAPPGLDDHDATHTPAVPLPTVLAPVVPARPPQLATSTESR